MSSTDTRGPAIGDMEPIKSVVASGQTGAAILLKTRYVTVTLIPAGGASGKVQYTTSSYTDIAAAAATWIDWAAGVVSATTSDIGDGPITALRVVSSSGICTMEVVQ